MLEENGLVGNGRIRMWRQHCIEVVAVLLYTRIGLAFVGCPSLRFRYRIDEDGVARFLLYKKRMRLSLETR